MKFLVVILCVFGLSSIQRAYAQDYSTSKVGDPNLKHFYMGRQEIEVIDNTPIVKYRNGPGSAAGQQGTPGVQGPQPLPAAGFQQYSSNVKGGPLNLPKVENGVPHQLPPAPLKGNTAKLKSKTSAQITAKKTPAAPAAIETYKQSYKTRSPSVTPNNGVSSTQKVHGKLLPFATTRHRANY
jgi:hypothetical protein